MKELPRLTPEELIEELREKAREEAEDMNLSMSMTALKLGLARKWTPEDMLEWEAADCIEELLSRLPAK